ncbi:hypothetical protein ACP4OV_002178 [Aristida adscensionis]
MAACSDKNPTESDETELYYHAYGGESGSEIRTLDDPINWSPCPHYAALGFFWRPEYPGNRQQE